MQKQKKSIKSGPGTTMPLTTLFPPQHNVVPLLCFLEIIFYDLQKWATKTINMHGEIKLSAGINRISDKQECIVQNPRQTMSTVVITNICQTVKKILATNFV